MRNFLFMLAVSSFMIACQKTSEDLIIPKDEEPVQPSTLSNNPNEAWKWLSITDKTQVSLEEAKREALEMAQQMTEAGDTKPVLFASTNHLLSSPISIEDVRIINTSRVPVKETSFRKREEERADFYLVHYANNRGYALVSGDKRVPGVLVYNSFGRLDSIVNAGQGVMLSLIEDYVEREKELYEKQKDSLRKEAVEQLIKNMPLPPQEHGSGFRKLPSQKDLRNCLRPGEQDAIEERLEVENHKTTIVEPLLKTLWNQEGKYNDLLDKMCTGGAEQVPVGCVAVAVGQIMAYHKKPNVFKGRQMHWDDMTKTRAGDMFSGIESLSNSTAVEDIQYLLARLGDKDLLQMNYTCKGSSANYLDAIKTFRTLGYETDGVKDINEWTITNNISRRQPVYIRGCYLHYKVKHGPFNLWTKTEFDKCHAWVLDGYVIHRYTYRRYYRSRCLQEPVKGTPFDETKMYVHCNFGWGGDLTGTSNYYGASGWYRMGIFDAEDHRVAPSKDHSSFRSVPDKKHYYQHDLKIITNIH